METPQDHREADNAAAEPQLIPHREAGGTWKPTIVHAFPHLLQGAKPTAEYIGMKMISYGAVPILQYAPQLILQGKLDSICMLRAYALRMTDAVCPDTCSGFALTKGVPPKSSPHREM